MKQRPHRAKPNDVEDSGQDSFLDIVTNVVGVLVILVLVVGVRASRIPVQPVRQSEELAEKKIQTSDPRGAELQEEVVSLSSQIMEFASQAREVGQDVISINESRDKFQLLVASAEAEIERRRLQMDATARRDFDLQTAIQHSQRQLTELMQQKLALDTVPSKSVKIENLPTPLSRSAGQQELHFQLMGGRIVYIPLDPLEAELKKEVRQEMQRLLIEKRSERVRTVGPIDGFRLRYYLRRIDIPVERQYELGIRSPLASLHKWELLPMANDLGETVDEALAENSIFRRTLFLNSPERVTVTVWTYPDSFDDFRRLKKIMYAAGYQTAARPLPTGKRIAATPGGTRSAAQ